MSSTNFFQPLLKYESAGRKASTNLFGSTNHTNFAMPRESRECFLDAFLLLLIDWKVGREKLAFFIIFTPRIKRLSHSSLIV